jgi:hypothetical protein
MKAVLLGLDFLNLDGQLKFLEMNTDTFIPHTSFNSFDFNALETYLVDNGFIKFRIIYKTEHVATEFISKLDEICTTHGIEFEPVLVSFDSITIPMFEDVENEFTLRLSYDITAIIDDLYARDKKELLSVIFNGNQTDLIPKTFFKKDDVSYDTFSTLIDNGVHPNFIVKKSLPDHEKTDYPQFYKLSTTEELDTLKNDIVNGDVIIQEFAYNVNNLYNGKIRDHIRYWMILCSDATTTIDFGGYVSPNALPLDEQYIDYTDSKLNEESRILYFSNPNRVGNGIPGTYEIVKIVDGADVVTTLSTIEIGDVVNAVKLPGLSDEAGVQGTLNWVHTGSYTDIEYTTASVIVKLVDTVDEWFIKINYNIGEDSGSMLVNLVELVLTSDVDGNNLTFKAASDLTAGDYIVISNTTIADVTSIGYERFNGDVVKLNIEPADVFVAGSNTNGIGQTIASNFIIYNYKQ